MELLTRMEEVLLLSVWKLQEGAYGLAVRKHVCALLNKKYSVGAIYMSLERLAKKGYLQTWESEPTDQRGGRRKRFYKLTGKGVQALNYTKVIHDQIWSEFPSLGTI